MGNIGSNFEKAFVDIGQGNFGQSVDDLYRGFTNQKPVKDRSIPSSTLGIIGDTAENLLEGNFGYVINDLSSAFKGEQLQPQKTPDQIMFENYQRVMDPNNPINKVNWASYVVSSNAANFGRQSGNLGVTPSSVINKISNPAVKMAGNSINRDIAGSMHDNSIT